MVLYVPLWLIRLIVTYPRETLAVTFWLVVAFVAVWSVAYGIAALRYLAS